jgi:hypothetical protein
MKFNWEEYLSIAKFLHEDDSCPREAACRSSVNRAYYGAFYSVRGFAKISGFKDEEANLEKLKNHLNKYKKSGLVNQIFSDLGDLEGWENDCVNSEDEISDIDNMSSIAQMHANQVINKLKELK